MRRIHEVEFNNDEISLLLTILNNQSSLDEKITVDNYKLIKNQFVIFSINEEFCKLNEEGKKVLENICEKLEIEVRK